MNNKVIFQKGLNSNQLKLIAIIAMTIDHLTWVFFPGRQKIWYVIILHIIGRLTAPIMWYFIAEGCHYTKDRKKYLIRLFSFAIISHFAYDFAFGIPYFDLSEGFFNRTSVMWSLALGASLIFIDGNKKLSQITKLGITIIFCILAFPSDWSSIAVMCPFYLYQHRGNFKKQSIDIVFWSFIYGLVYFIFLDKIYGVLQLFTFLTIPLLSKYNENRGTWKGMKWFFYIYYPAHLFIIGIIRLLLHGNVPIL